MEFGIKGNERVRRKTAPRLSAPVPDSAPRRPEQSGHGSVAAKLIDYSIGGRQDGGTLCHASPLVHETWTGQVHETLIASKNAAGDDACMFRDDLPIESRENIGIRLRLTREALGFSQADFARQLGISRSRLEGYEVGRNLLKPEAAVPVFKIAPSAKLDFNWLYHGDLSSVSHDFAMKVKERLGGQIVA